MSQKQIHLLSPLFLAIWLLGLGSIWRYHSSLWTSLWAQFNSLSSKFPHFSKVMTGDSDVQNFKMAKDECSLTRWALWKWGWVGERIEKLATLKLLSKSGELLMDWMRTENLCSESIAIMSTAYTSPPTYRASLTYWWIEAGIWWV